MRRFTALIMAGLLAGALALPVGAAPPDRNFVAAPLRGTNEIPAVESDGVGTAVLRLNKTETALSFLLIVSNLEDMVQAHIHCGSADVNGPVVAFLFGPANPAVTQNGFLARGVITNGQVIPRPDSAECPGGVADFDDLVAHIRAGNAYVNVHTTSSPGGEIRAQVG